MDYRCISADCHIDLNWLPYDLFVSNATHAMKERMPYVMDGREGPMWVTRAGVNFGLANGKGGAGATSSGRKYYPGSEHRLDRIASTGLYSDGLKGICRPATPELRLQDQDRDGIQAEVLYGLLNAGNRMTDREASVEFYRIYNDWLLDFCQYDCKRFIGLASIPSHNTAVAVAETRRVAKLGLRGLDVSASWDMTPLWNPDWEPFWKAAAEANLPVHFHILSAPPTAPVPENSPENVKIAAVATKLAGAQLPAAAIMAGLIYSGALERYPTLRIVFGETGIGWIPHVLTRMDYAFGDRFKGRVPMKMKPSDYWHRQCQATFQYDPIGVKLLDELGVDNIMWGSDYPHADAVFPDSQEFIEKQFGQLPKEIKHKIICGNVVATYGLA